MTTSVLRQMVYRLSRLPGLGPRSGRRAALFLLKNRAHLLKPLIDAMQNAHDKVFPCSVCGYFDTQNPCIICTDKTRDSRLLCIVTDVSDVWALEHMKTFKGHYHVLGGNLSVLDGIGPKDLRLPSLLKRLQNPDIQEIILALTPTPEGTTTAHYIQEELQKQGVLEDKNITLLARGLPMGSDFDFLDPGTLTAAFQGRKRFE